MLVEAADHHLDEVSLSESSKAGDRAISVSDIVEHRNDTLAVLEHNRVFSKAVLLEFEPRAVTLLEYNLISKNGCLSIGDRLIPSDFNVGANELHNGGLDSGRTGSGGEGENLREITSSTDVLSTDSESVLSSFLESVNGSSRLEESVNVVGQRPFDSLGWVSLVPDDFEFSILIVVGPGKIERSDSGEAEFLKNSHGSGLSTDGASLDVGDGNVGPSSLVVSSASGVDVFTKSEVVRSLREDIHGDTAG
jgi:hypothetical protein